MAGDFDAEFTKIKNDMVLLRSVEPILRALAANPSLLAKLGADAGSASGDAGKFMADIAKLSGDVEVLVEMVAGLVNPIAEQHAALVQRVAALEAPKEHPSEMAGTR